jgi:transcriptional regulator with XRE-family HTH domain
MSIESTAAHAALADRLQKALTFADLSPAQMADRLGASESTMNAWLSGKTAPRLAGLLMWASTCGVPFEWLAGTEEDQVPPRHHA